MSISLKVKLEHGLVVPFNYNINSYEEGIELIVEALRQGADLRGVSIKL